MAMGSQEPEPAEPGSGTPDEEERTDSLAPSAPHPPEAAPMDREPLLGAGAQWTLQLLDDSEDECPICTEPYGAGEHLLVLLNCGHGLCQHCLNRLLGTAPSTDLGRVRCPLCRQKTPMLEWEICQLQEELLQADGPQPPPPPSPPALPPRGTGPWASLEHRYHLRGNRGCLPFLPCPPCLIARLWALRDRGPCVRCLVLLTMLALEMFGLVLIFLPLLLLALLFILLNRSGH
ncbi:ring finger protein-like [Monodelphis domestica]|uniref:ring finger protein-like n=1 Tax=Monodelphis domestica TaxID=13616 RepID=UPI0024E24E9C|nr:ring finger protein-like [Monodelphis domestica]XP_007475517.2 ring finger protein-like [Monodelphis domestica]